MPEGMSDILALLEAKTAFGVCVDGAMKRQNLDDARLATLVVERKLADELHSEVLGRFSRTDAWLKGFATTTTDPQRLKVEQALHALAAISAAADNADPLTPGGADPFDGMNAIHGFYRVVNRAMDNACEVPAAIVEAEATVNTLEPLLAEVDRVESCAKLELQKRGLDEAAAYARLDGSREGPALREHALAMLDALDLDPERKRGIDRERIEEIVEAYSFYVSMNFDIESIARSTGLKAIYLNRAVGSACDPSETLIRFLGVPTSADH